MKLDPVSLHDACRSLALATLKDSERSTEAVDLAAALYYSLCEMQLPRLKLQGSDPNLLTRAVAYLTHSHAVPLGADPPWFQEALLILIEMASPSKKATFQSVAFLDDVMAGIEMSVASLHE